MDTQLQLEYEKDTGVPFTDSLTGLFTHGFFHTAFDWECKRFPRQGRSFTLGLIDIDSFASYNRINGHAKGDQILKEIARIISQSIRQADLAARYSGDVFALLLLDTGVDEARIASERIRLAVTEKYAHQVTISAGLASFPADASHKAGLMEKAQEALLQAKRTGKNKVHFFVKAVAAAADSRASILVVDDEPRNLKLMEALLTPLQYQVIKAHNGEEALTLVSKMGVDLILLDVMMPVMDGYEVCRRLKNNEATRLIPIIMVTALNDMESKVKGIEAGADDFLSKPANKIEIQARTKSLIMSKRLNDNLTSVEDVLFSLANAVEAKDRYTQGHTQRVADMAVLLGKTMSLAAHEIASLRVGGILHDIGKIGIPRDILNKQGKLTPDEWAVMKQHPEIGYRICLPLRRTLGLALDMIQHHHEKLDGSGYPDGLRGDEVSVVARIMAVVDIYDALTSDRPYRKGMPKEQALSILREEADAGKLDTTVIAHLL